MGIRTSLDMSLIQNNSTFLGGMRVQAHEGSANGVKSHSKENSNSCTGTESSEKNINRLWHSNVSWKFS